MAVSPEWDWHDRGDFPTNGPMPTPAYVSQRARGSPSLTCSLEGLGAAIGLSLAHASSPIREVIGPVLRGKTAS
jgi:hypothetical protein